tara:strand:+ start:2079 stop:2198 length:120 start_codon:yes stop_codon:yes gene_type:complete
LTENYKIKDDFKHNGLLKEIFYGDLPEMGNKNVDLTNRP